MANVKTFKDLEDSLRRKARKLAKESGVIEKEAAELSAELIKTRTKRGFGVNKDGAPKERLKKLSPGYVKQRAREGLTAKSRLGRTDQMLDSITSKKGEVFLKGERNKKVAEFAEDSGRPFMHLSSPEKKKVTALLQEKISDFFKKLN